MRSEKGHAPAAASRAAINGVMRDSLRVDILRTTDEALGHDDQTSDTTLPPRCASFRRAAPRQHRLHFPFPLPLAGEGGPERSEGPGERRARAYVLFTRFAARNARHPRIKSEVRLFSRKGRRKSHFAPTGVSSNTRPCFAASAMSPRRSARRTVSSCGRFPHHRRRPPEKRRRLSFSRRVRAKLRASRRRRSGADFLQTHRPSCQEHPLFEPSP